MLVHSGIHIMLSATYFTLASPFYIPKLKRFASMLDLNQNSFGSEFVETTRTKKNLFLQDTVHVCFKSPELLNITVLAIQPVGGISA